MNLWLIGGLGLGAAALWYVSSQQQQPSSEAPSATDESFLSLANRARAEGVQCFGPAAFREPLVPNAALSTVAQASAARMAAAGAVAPATVAPEVRVLQAGYRVALAYDFIGVGPSPSEVMAVWLRHPEYCFALGDPLLSAMGVGRAVGADGQIYHSVVLAAPL